MIDEWWTKQTKRPLFALRWLVATEGLNDDTGLNVQYEDFYDLGLGEELRTVVLCGVVVITPEIRRCYKLNMKLINQSSTDVVGAAPVTSPFRKVVNEYTRDQNRQESTKGSK